MLTAIPSQIIKLMSTYFRKAHKYGGCKKLSTSRANWKFLKFPKLQVFWISNFRIFKIAIFQNVRNSQLLRMDKQF